MPSTANDRYPALLEQQMKFSISLNIIHDFFNNVVFFDSNIDQIMLK